MFASAVLIALAGVISYFIWNLFHQISSYLKAFYPNLSSKQCLKKIFCLHGITEMVLDAYQEMVKNYPSPFQIPYLSKFKPVIMIYEPDQVKAVLQSRHCLEKSHLIYKFIKQLMDTGLVTVLASLWTPSRKIIAPTFNSNMLRRFSDIFVEESLIMTNNLEENLINEKGNFLRCIRKCAAFMAYEAFVGIKVERNKLDEIGTTLESFHKIYEYRINVPLPLHFFFYFDAIFNLTAKGREQKKVLKEINSFVTKIMQQYSHERDLNEAEATKKIFLNILTKASQEKYFTEEMVRDNIITMIVAAADTISVTSYFAVFMLANFPEVQAKAYKELSEIYGTETPMSAPVKYDDLQHMHYLDRLIKETLRLFPPIPILGRELSENMKIGHSTFPKNTTVGILLLSMFRDEKYWPNPLKFDPDRFLPERLNNHSYYFIPFSDGPRNCIGMRYATIAMKIMLASLIRTYVFKVDKSIQIDEIKLKITAGLEPSEPLKFRFEKRNS